eukprot:m.112678 g.112678  ORF g.112678 m.112678 type:complete len:572 (-) comp10788_c0_seq5:108-1823(-)
MPYTRHLAHLRLVRTVLVALCILSCGAPSAASAEATHKPTQARGSTSITETVTSVRRASPWVQQATVHINGTRLVGRTRPEYVSFNFEFGTGGAGGPTEGLARLEFLTRQLAPAFLRVGGNSADVTVYALGREAGCKPHNNSGPHGAPGVGMAERCFTPEQLHSTAEFARQTGIKVVFDVNEYYSYGSPGENLGGGPRPQRQGPINLTNAEDLLAWWAENPTDAPAMVTLGNELPNNLSPAVTATDFAAFNRLLHRAATQYASAHGNHSASPPTWIPTLLGTDAWWKNQTWVRTLVAQPELPPLAAFTFHLYLLGEDISADRLLDPSVLDSAVTFASGYNVELAKGGRAGLPLWITEAGAAWGGDVDTFAPSYIDGFWFLDQLGSLAQHNVVVQHRHALAGSWGPCFIGEGPAYIPRPDYFTAVLWRQLVGTGVVGVTTTSDGNGSGKEEVAGTLRVYAHCHASSPHDTLTLVIINLVNRSWAARIDGLTTQTPVDTYWLTPGNATAGLVSSTVALHGETLTVHGGPDGPWSLPNMVPTVDRLGDGGTLNVPPLRYGFVTVPLSVPACAQG